MRRLTLLAAIAALGAAALWHLPATAQHATTPALPPAPVGGQAAAAPPEKITFDAYRDFRLRYIATRRASLAEQLATPGVAAEAKTRLERIKTYYDQLAAMPAAARDKLFRARFDEIDTDRDGTLDAAERAAWRNKQRQHYAELAATRAKGGGAKP